MRARALLVLLAVAWAPAACDPGTTGPPAAVDLSPLPLAWPLDGGLSVDELRQGIDWNLGLLGALPPADGAHLVLAVDGDWVRGELDLAASGFAEHAQPALTDALAELRDSDALAATGAVDPGRLFMLTLHEPWRYYSITGACGRVEQWRHQRLAAEPDRYDVVASLLSGGDRSVLLSPDGTPVQQVGLAVATGVADLDDPDWVPGEFESIDLMSNGQQRFATYGVDGWIQPWADSAVVPAGQPGNCLWCHEGNLMLGTHENPSTASALSYADWALRIGDWQAELEAWRQDQPTAIDWSDPQAHTWAERVVRDFLHPTAARAAVEWGLDPADADALQRAEGLWEGEDEEWPDRGRILRRAEVDAVLEEQTGVRPVEVLPDARLPVQDVPLRGQEWADWLPCEGELSTR